MEISLSPREKAILLLLIEGHSNKQIADKECISLHTVDFHRRNIYRKLGVSNSAGLVIKGGKLLES